MKLLDELRNKLPDRAKSTLTPDEFSGLETRLQATLVPVAPRPEFVERLSKQLLTAAPLTRGQSSPIVEGDPNSRESLLIGAATLVGAAALLVAGFRVAVTMVGMIGIFVQWISRKTSGKQTTVQPTA